MNREKQYESYNEDTHEGNFFKGMMWATVFSIPLWISFFGWIKLLASFIH